jgi:hypothetical protein
MKKMMLTAVAVITFAFSNAQETRAGIKGGINIATLTGDAEGATSRVGFQAGGFLEIKITDRFAIQPELLFSTQGVHTEIVKPDNEYKIEKRINLMYLNIPIMARFYVVDKFSVEAGPQIGFLARARATSEITSYGNRVSGEEDLKRYLRAADLGVNFGAGYDFTEDLSIGIRYNIGCSNLGENMRNYEMYNRVLSVSAGYKF